LSLRCCGRGEEGSLHRGKKAPHARKGPDFFQYNFSGNMILLNPCS
jgi:hypothetical protein